MPLRRNTGTVLCCKFSHRRRRHCRVIFRSFFIHICAVCVLFFFLAKVKREHGKNAIKILCLMLFSFVRVFFFNFVCCFFSVVLLWSFFVCNGIPCIHHCLPPFDSILQRCLWTARTMLTHSTRRFEQRCEIQFLFFATSSTIVSTILLLFSQKYRENGFDSLFVRL